MIMKYYRLWFGCQAVGVPTRKWICDLRRWMAEKRHWTQGI